MVAIALLDWILVKANVSLDSFKNSPNQFMPISDGISMIAQNIDLSISRILLGPVSYALHPECPHTLSVLPLLIEHASRVSPFSQEQDLDE